MKTELIANLTLLSHRERGKERIKKTDKLSKAIKIFFSFDVIYSIK